MGTIIRKNASNDAIAETVQKTYDNAIAHGGEIESAAMSRLGPSIGALENVREMRQAARKAAVFAWTTVLAEDAPADILIGATRDEMWNALGRPGHSSQLDEVFPGGVKTYTSGDPRQQPVLMEVLRSRILAASAPQWPESKRAAWAAAIESRRATYADAVEAHRPLEAAELVAEATYRAAVRSAHARLGSFKRDLKNLGLTESQIHEIIPDAGKPSSKKRSDATKNPAASLPA